MGQVKIAVKSRAPLDRLYQVAQSAYEYVYAMPNVKEIIVVERSACGSRSTAEWVLDVPLPGEFGRLAWIKTAVWDNVAKTCTLALSPLYQGVVKKIEGLWEFRESGAGAEMLLTMHFHIEHPLVNPFVHRIFDGLIKKNNEALLNEVRKIAEAAA